MSHPDLTSVELRAVGRTWRGGGAALVVIAAMVLVVAKGRNLGMHSPLMIGGFAVLALGWILAFIGVFLRSRQAKRLRETP
jgi:hypothetical protein